MPLIPIRRDRTSKPPIGTPLRSDGHWSVQGLVGAWALNEGAGRVVNAAGGEIGGENTGVWGADGLSFATTSAGLISKNIHNLPEHSIIAAIKWDGGTLNFSRIFDKGSNPVRFEVRSTSELYFSAQHADYTNSIWRTTNLSLVSGVPCIVGASASTTTQTGQLYKNGKPLAMGTHTTGNGAIINSAANPTLSRSGTNFWPGYIYWLLYFSRLLPDTEMSSLSANPWQIYEPETVWIEVGGGGEAALFAGSIYGQSSASALLSTEIRMAASAQGHGASTADLNTTIALAAEILAASSASGALSTAIRFGGALSGASTTTAALTNAITMAAQAVGLGSISGQLAGTVAAALFAGTISGSSSASANLSTAVVLAAAAQGNATAQAALSTALELAAQVNGVGSAAGTLGADISGLAGSLHGSSEAQATLSTAIRLMGVAAGQCGVVGRLAEPVEILAQLRVMASDPLALTISVRDPLALRVTVQ